LFRLRRPAALPHHQPDLRVQSAPRRAPAIATGLALSRPDLSVWVVTGDGDALSIGGNHLIHALRRNVNVKILLFNNQIYGLTKGQYSPTSPLGTVNKTTPMGSLDWPFNPVALALGAEATFVGRSIDTDRAHLTEVLRRAYAHPGAAFVEIYQNCNVYNDGAFDAVREDKENRIRLEHGKPIRFGADDERGVRLRSDGSAELVDGVSGRGRSGTACRCSCCTAGPGARMTRSRGSQRWRSAGDASSSTTSSGAVLRTGRTIRRSGRSRPSSSSCKASARGSSSNGCT